MSRPDEVPAVVVERGEPPHGGPAERTLDRARAPGRSLPMLWRVFAANATVLTLAFALLALAPVKLHASIRLEELVLLIAGLVVMLVVDLVLLRHALGPLSRLSRVMGTIDLLRPGQRALGFERSSSEVLALAAAFNEMLGRLEDERRESSARVLAAQEGERLRIARELHDEIGQTLTAVALRAEHAVTLAGAERSDLEQLAEIVQHSLQEVRRIYRELRPEALDELGLRGALVALTGRIGEQGGIHVERDLAGDLPDVSPDVELAVYRIAQEALTNAMRHSGAGEVTVSLRSADGALTLIVADDGRGLPDDPAPGGGLTGMRERALLIGGELRIESGTQRGTVVTLAVPLDGDG